MAEHLVHTFPGQTSAAVTKGYFGKWDTSNKIALVTTAGARSNGVISRTVGSGEASGLKFGICEMIASAAITAGDGISAAASGKARTKVAGDYVGGIALTAATADGDTFLAYVFESAKQQDFEKVASLTVTGAAGSTGVFASWQNPESGTILITEAKLLISTQSTGASTLDIGTTATSATTNSDNLIDGLSGAAAGVFSNLGSGGTNGKQGQTLATGKWVNVGEASGDVDGLAATLYIKYIVV